MVLKDVQRCECVMCCDAIFWVIFHETALSLDPYNAFRTFLTRWMDGWMDVDVNTIKIEICLKNTF